MDQYWTLNSSGESFEMTQTIMRMKETADGRSVPAMIFDRVSRAVEYRDYGIEFNVTQPGVGSVEAVFRNRRGFEARVSLSNKGKGIFSGVTAAPAPGVYELIFLGDGVPFLYSRAPLAFMDGAHRNYFEVPDPGTDVYGWLDVPHGTLHCDNYYSGLDDALKCCWVHTPAGYDDDPEEEYPVLYMRGRAGDSEANVFFMHRAHFISDNLLAEGRAEKMIIVSGLSGNGLKESDAVTDAEVNELIRYIDSRYRTRKRASARAFLSLEPADSDPEAAPESIGSRFAGAKEAEEKEEREIIRKVTERAFRQ